MEKRGAKFKGSFLGRNMREGNTGMHHSKARGKISSLDAAGIGALRRADGSRPWCLTELQVQKAVKVFRALDKDGSCCLDPSELTQTFGIETLTDEIDLNQDNQVSLREWKKYIADLKATLFHKLSIGCSRPAIIARRLSVVPNELDGRSPPVVAGRTEEEFNRFLDKMQLKVSVAQPSTNRFDWAGLSGFIAEDSQSWQKEVDHLYETARLDEEEDKRLDCQCDEFACTCGGSRPVTRGSDWGGTMPIGTPATRGSSRGSQRSRTMSPELMHLRACITSPTVEPAVDASECICDKDVCSCG